jgi:hypothetical protein
MAVYAVDYDLRKPGRNYDDLYKELQKFPGYCPVLESFWFIVSERTAVQVHDQLKPRMDANDGLVVHEVRKSNAAWSGLKSNVTEWMKKYL